MIELARGLSFVAYEYEGGPLRFTVTFPYLLPEHVRVLVGDPESPRTLAPRWVNSNTIEIPDQSEYLQVPFTVQLRRFTPIEKPQVHFTDAAMLPARQLNTAVRQLLYAQQELIEFGLDGNGLPGGGLPGGGGGNIPDIQTIVDAVVQSPAYQILQQRIPEIDANAELVMEEILRSNDNFDLNRDHGDRISEAVRRITLTESAQEVIAQDLLNLLARVDTLDADVAAEIQQLFQAIADEEGARAQALLDLHAQITQETSTFVAQYVEDIEVAVNDLEATVDANTGAIAAHGDALSAVNEDLSLLSNAEGANTTWRQMFASQWGGQGATGDSVAASVKSEIATKATPEEAEAISNQTVSAFADGQFADLQQSFSSYVDANDGRWESTWSIRINGGDVNNPVIGGIALSGSPSGFDFVAAVDRFAITTPNGTYNNRKFPFVVGTVGGLSTVGITGQLLVDGSITADKITANTLSAITANAGTINGGTFKTHTLNAQGEVTNPSEFRVEVSNVGTYPLWIGQGNKNQNNAVFWVDREGNAGFAGRVSAPNITGTLQRIVAVNWYGSIEPRTWDTEVTRFTLPAPVLQGESHRPVFSFMVNVQSITSSNGAFQLALERLQGSQWVEVSRSVLTQGSGHGINHAIHAIGPSTSSETTYRLTTLAVNNGERVRVQTCVGHVYGLR